MSAIKQSKFYNNVNKKPVVVFADGVTDDTDAIQKIVNGDAYGVDQDGRNILGLVLTELTQPTY